MRLVLTFLGQGCIAFRNVPTDSISDQLQQVQVEQSIFLFAVLSPQSSLNTRAIKLQNTWKSLQVNGSENVGKASSSAWLHPWAFSNTQFMNLQYNGNFKMCRLTMGSAWGRNKQWTINWTLKTRISTNGHKFSLEQSLWFCMSQVCEELTICKEHCKCLYLLNNTIVFWGKLICRSNAALLP